MRTISPASLTMTIASGVDSSSSRKGRILVVFTASYACHVMTPHTTPIGRDLVADSCLGRCSDIASFRSAHEGHRQPNVLTTIAANLTYNEGSAAHVMIHFSLVKMGLTW